MVDIPGISASYDPVLHSQWYGEYRGIKDTTSGERWLSDVMTWHRQASGGDSTEEAQRRFISDLLLTLTKAGVELPYTTQQLRAKYGYSQVAYQHPGTFVGVTPQGIGIPGVATPQGGGSIIPGIGTQSQGSPPGPPPGIERETNMPFFLAPLAAGLAYKFGKPVAVAAGRAAISRVKQIASRGASRAVDRSVGLVSTMAIPGIRQGNSTSDIPGVGPNTRIPADMASMRAKLDYAKSHGGLLTEEEEYAAMGRRNRTKRRSTKRAPARRAAPRRGTRRAPARRSSSRSRSSRRY